MWECLYVRSEKIRLFSSKFYTLYSISVIRQYLFYWVAKFFSGKIQRDKYCPNIRKALTIINGSIAINQNLKALNRMLTSPREKIWRRKIFQNRGNIVELITFIRGCTLLASRQFYPRFYLNERKTHYKSQISILNTLRCAPLFLRIRINKFVQNKYLYYEIQFAVAKQHYSFQRDSENNLLYVTDTWFQFE